MAFNGRFRERALVHAVAKGFVSVPEFVAAHESWGLEELSKKIENPDKDLNDNVDAWQLWLRSRKRTTEGTRAKYLQQLRELIPADTPFPASQFSRRTISEFLSGLGLRAPNRYRAALSSFGKFLVEREVLLANPVREVQGAKEADSRCRWLDSADAKRVINLIDSDEARAIHALMCGTGMEIGAVFATHRRDVNLAAKTVEAHGTKRWSRDRTVRVTKPWCFGIFKKWVQQLQALPTTPIFTMTYDDASKALKRALKTAEIENYRSHDWRHTYAVQAIRDGRPLQVVAHQLGHKTTVMVQKVYGRYVPDSTDYEIRQTFGRTAASGGRPKRTSKRVTK